ncbi:MAG: adenylate cyclase, partial [Deltaproteobacteria bacterium]|nr:adenylate cyclase [Deltaproteobacteria bacterium]
AFMALNRLGDRDVAAFVSHLAGNSLLPRETVEEIVERTDGVPLFGEELTKAVLEESGRDRRVAAVLSGSPLRGLVVPASLHASLVARLDRIGGVAKEIAQVGAVLGREFLYELISGATQLRDIDLQAGLASLVHAGLLFCRGTPPHASYLFKHALVQDAAYSTLLRSRRQELHSRVAGLLESRFNEIAERQPELVARHLMAAGLAERAFDYWLRAGKLSLAKSAVREATAQLNRALTLLPNFSEDRRARQELDVLATLGPALISSKGYAAPEVISTLDRARQLIAETRSTGTDLHFFVLYGLCAVLYVAGDPRAMIEEANTFLTLAQSQPATGPVLVGHRLLGTGMMMMGDYTNASGHLEKACQLYDPHEHQHLAVRYGQDIGVSALVYFGWSLWHQGQPEKSKSMIKSAVEHARNCDHTHTLTYALLHAAVGSMLLRELAAATAYADECIALATEHGFPLWRALGQIVSGWALSQQDQASAAAVRIREGLAAAERTGSRWLEPWFMGLLAQALGSAGQLNDAKIIVQDALERAAVSGQQCADAELNRIGGELNSLLGSNLAESDRQLSLAVNVARRQGSIGFELRTAISLARLWNEQGRQTQARDLLEPIYGRFTEGRDTVDLKEAKALLDNLN